MQPWHNDTEFIITEKYFETSLSIIMPCEFLYGYRQKDTTKFILI